MRKTPIRFALAAALAAGLASTSFAHENHGPKVTPSADRVISGKGEEDRARAYFTDTVLTTHDGKKVKFYSDLLANKTVVVSFIFTSCQGACPLMNHTLQKVQEKVGARMGKDIVFLSITVDPATDTPAVLAKYRKSFGAGPAWTFITGDKRSLDLVSSKMGQVFEKDAHLTAFLVGNTKTGRWRKIAPHLPPPNIASQIKEIADAGGR